MSSIYDASLKVVGERIRATDTLVKHHDRILQQSYGTLSWSSFCQELAIQAALQAAMMGAAGAIGGAATNSIRASAAVAMEGQGFWASLKIGFLAELKAAGARLATRVAIGCSVVVLRKAYAKFYRDESFFDGKLATGLALATFCGLVGVPGDKVKGLVLEGPGLKSFQTLVQSIGMAGGVARWMNMPENKELANFIASNRAALKTSSEKAAAAIGEECVNWATANEQNFANAAAQEVRKIDFSTQLNLAAKINDMLHDVKIANILKEQTVNCAMAEARKSLWLAVSQGIREIEYQRYLFERAIEVLRRF